jgi:DNA-binding response OmpR family regulator
MALHPIGRLLIVDDNIDLLDMLRDHFSELGYFVDRAEDGSQAIAKFRDHRPDAVLLDLRLPDMSGETVFQSLRRIDGATAIVVVSANEDANRAKELLKLGAFDYVSKPIDFPYLERAVAAAVGTSPRQKKRFAS